MCTYNWAGLCSKVELDACTVRRLRAGVCVEKSGLVVVSWQPDHPTCPAADDVYLARASIPTRLLPSAVQPSNRDLKFVAFFEAVYKRKINKSGVKTSVVAVRTGSTERSISDGAKSMVDAY